MTIPALRDELRTRLLTLPAVEVAKEWGDVINVSGNRSVAVIEKGTTEYDAAHKGQANWVGFTVHMLVAKDPHRTAVEKLDAFCDPTPNSATSVRTAVNGPFGGGYVKVQSDSEYREYPVGEGEAAPRYLGCAFVVQVLT